MKIAIDGPAGAGKSTIAKLLSEELGFIYLDTGATYRTVALAAISAGANLSSADEVKKVLDGIKIDVRYIDGVQHTYLNGCDVSQDIRKPEISKAASAVSALNCVRVKMVELQREIASKNNTVLDGRDIGTFVLPDAEFKFFLTATVAARASRRYKELCNRGIIGNTTLKQIESDIAERDYNDSHREFSPLKKADDAITVDTTDMSIRQVADFMLNIINGQKNEKVL